MHRISALHAQTQLARGCHFKRGAKPKLNNSPPPMARQLWHGAAADSKDDLDDVPGQEITSATTAEHSWEVKFWKNVQLRKLGSAN
jgi:hypothetical protein